MRSKPTRIVSWTAVAGVPFSCGAVFGLSGIARAGELAEAVSPANDWPWIAIIIVVGLLGVVAYVSRRRIHSVVGS
jgi:hypothetical protein